MMYTVETGGVHMVNRLVLRLTNALVSRKYISVGEQEQYIYAMENMIESIITLFSVIVIAILAHVLLETIGFLAFFLGLRKRTGGYHLDRFWKCYIGTILIYILIYLLGNLNPNMVIMYILSGIAGLVIFIIGSVNHPNVDWNTEELLETKSCARYILCVEFMFIFFLITLNINKKLVIYLMLAIIVCSILLLVAKILGQEVKINEKM